MKSRKIITTFLAALCLFLVPCIANAANASATNWRIFCDKESMGQNESATCYLISQITNAKKKKKNISAVLVNIQNQGTTTGDAVPSFNTIQVEKTIASAKFNNSLHGSTTNCPQTGNCYDFTSTQGITSNTSDTTLSGKGYTGYTPIGYWKVNFDGSGNTNGSVCATASYIVDGKTTNAVFADNGSCAKITLSNHETATCYYDSSTNKYYGTNGTEVSSDVYNSECQSQVVCDADSLSEADLKKCVCKMQNGKYFGEKGTETTKEEFEKTCVPKTGSFASYAVLAAGALIAISAITVAKKHNRFYKV